MTKHKCDHCGEEFGGKHRLTWHINEQHSHFSQQRFPCNNDKCEKSYETVPGLIYHIKKFHNNETWRCSDCGKKFFYKYQFVQHGTCNYSQRKFPCNWPECEKRFESRKNLRRHIKDIHVSEEFHCSDCGRKFAQKRVLREHIFNKHMACSERKFACNIPVCKKRFLSKGRLNAHIKRVHDSSEFQCSYCNEKFKNEDLLVKHRTRKHPEYEH